MPPEHLVPTMLSSDTPRQPHWQQVGDQCAAGGQRFAGLLTGRNNGKFGLASMHPTLTDLHIRLCNCLNPYRMSVELAMLWDPPAHVCMYDCTCC